MPGRKVDWINVAVYGGGLLLALAIWYGVYNMFHATLGLSPLLAIGATLLSAFCLSWLVAKWISGTH